MTLEILAEKLSLTFVVIVPEKSYWQFFLLSFLKKGLNELKKKKQQFHTWVFMYKWREIQRDDENIAKEIFFNLGKQERRNTMNKVSIK